jgi:SAM-dependent methyltransferase
MPDYNQLLVSYPYPSAAHRLQDGLLILPEVPNPAPDNLMLIKYLYLYRKRFEKGDVADIGCGSGVLGLMMLAYGATHVTFSDISRNAIQNTRINIERYKFSTSWDLIKTDLFRKHTRKYNFIVFNHPFNIASTAVKNLHPAFVCKQPIFGRFLTQARRRLKSDGCILAHYFPAGTSRNDPEIAANSMGLSCATLFKQKIQHRNVVGLYKIYLIQM